MRESNSRRKIIYVGDVQGTEKGNDTYVKTMARGFNVCKKLVKISISQHLRQS
jgi:hypothetical protein